MSEDDDREMRGVRPPEGGADSEPDQDDDEAPRYEHLTYTIKRMRSKGRLDKYLASRLGKRASRNAVQRYIDEGNVTVNGRAVKRKYALRPGDVIDLYLPTTRPAEIPAEPIPLDIVYEDDDVMAISKQADLIVHPARGNWTGTLVNALAWYFEKNWRDIQELPTSGEVFRPGIVHRLDRDTTGIMLVAKTELALWRLGKQFENREVEKTYTAIVHGAVRLDEDVIDQPIGRHPKIREKYAVHHDTGLPHPIMTKEAVTRYRVLKRMRAGVRDTAFTLVELYPKTGRTHQLRVHLSAIGHPIVGDRMYGGGPLYRSQLAGRDREAVGPIICRQALHAHTIAFNHPRTDERMSLTAPWPEDFQRAFRELAGDDDDIAGNGT